ncbi:MAG: RING finger domain-containing protein [Candidatus Helarchaeales archaeon]
MKIVRCIKCGRKIKSTILSDRAIETPKGWVHKFCYDESDAKDYEYITLPCIEETNTTHSSTPVPSFITESAPSRPQPQQHAKKGEKCQICHAPFSKSENIETCKSCGATFHNRCILRWLEENPDSKKCPACLKSWRGWL